MATAVNAVGPRHLRDPIVAAEPGAKARPGGITDM
jgi:hypothetical protein